MPPSPPALSSVGFLPSLPPTLAANRPAWRVSLREPTGLRTAATGAGGAGFRRALPETTRVGMAGEFIKLPNERQPCNVSLCQTNGCNVCGFMDRFRQMLTRHQTAAH